MDSYVDTQYNHHQQENSQHQQNEQQNSGLLRYRSAPSSFFFEYTQNSSDSDKYNDRFREDYSESYETKPLSLDSQGGYSGSGQFPAQYPKQSGVVSTSASMENSLLDINQSAPQENGHVGGGGVGLNLARQNSSPADFFNQLNPQNGYTIMRGLGSFRVGNGTNDTSSPRGTRLAISSLPRIPEIGTENVRETSPDEVKFRNHDQGDARIDGTSGYSFASWSDSGSKSSLLSEIGRPNMLTHHLSLPKTSTEMAAIEKLLHVQDSVPWKIRAKRGYATHPRSIAERVRRNRISERMRKLQDLVPNMDKQTNTADMLDLAVDYIKNLQNQFKVLSSNREKCKCVNLQ